MLLSSETKKISAVSRVSNTWNLLFDYFCYMKATFPGEFIHMIIVELPTLQDGTVIMFISVDNFSRYCFSNAVVSPLTFEKMTDHLDTIINELRKHHPALLPTCVMGYGEEIQPQLIRHYEGKARFNFNEMLADDIAQPVAKDLLKQLNAR